MLVAAAHAVNTLRSNFHWRWGTRVAVLEIYIYVSVQADRRQALCTVRLLKEEHFVPRPK